MQHASFCSIRLPADVFHLPPPVCLIPCECSIRHITHWILSVWEPAWDYGQLLPLDERRHWLEKGWERGWERVRKCLWPGRSLPGFLLLLVITVNTNELSASFRKMQLIGWIWYVVTQEWNSIKEHLLRHGFTVPFMAIIKCITPSLEVVSSSTFFPFQFSVTHVANFLFIWLPTHPHTHTAHTVQTLL